MKKILTIASVVLAAAAMQAASFAWGCATENSMDTADDGWAQEGTVYTLIFMGDTAPGTPKDFNPSTGVTDLGGTAVASHTLTYDEYDGGSFMDSYVAGEDKINGWYMVTMFDATTSTDFGDFKVFQISGLTDTGSAGDAGPAMAGLGTSMGSISAQAVPEPCSVALLALGLAAFGLKRKVA